MKINKQIFEIILNRPKFLNFFLRLSNFENYPYIQNLRNKILAKAIEGIYSAGETLASAERRIEELEQRNIGVILNYAMEAGKYNHLIIILMFLAGSNGIKVMEAEYYNILSCLKNHSLSCIALKPTALIQEDKILYLSELMKNEFYDSNINLDNILSNSEIEKIAEPFCKLSQKAIEINSKILIDAEQSNLQPGVDLLVMFLMKKFNRNSKAYIYNTYQLYLKDSPSRIEKHKKWIETNNAHFAAKLVRGAYLSFEKSSKAQIHRNYTICSSKADVDASYNDILKRLILDGTSSLVVATHNLESYNLLKSLLNQTKQTNLIEYAFLMGFGDKIRQPADDIRCLEYVPYGPSKVKIPYLLRRLEENVSIFQNNK